MRVIYSVFFSLFCPVSSPRRFRAKILSPTRLHVSWKEPKGQFESYKVVYSTQPGKTLRAHLCLTTGGVVCSTAPFGPQKNRPGLGPSRIVLRYRR